MERFTSFQITSLTVGGFRNFDTPAMFRFGPITRIVGGNGKGKSSIGEAIAFAITGVPMFGGTKLDSLYHGETREISIALTFTDGNGNTHMLNRRRVNDKMEIYFDSMAIRQKDLDYMFGERDLVLSIFNPLYFIECLGDEGAALLERYLPVIPDGRIMEALNEVDHETLSGIEMVSPDGLIRQLNMDNKRAGEKIVYLRGQRDLLEGQTSNRLAEIETAIKKRDAALIRLNELIERRFEGLNVAELDEMLVDLYAENDELRNEMPASTAEIDEQIKQTIFRLEQARARTHHSLYAGKLSECEVALEKARGEYAQARKMYSGIKPGLTCPTCRQTVTEDNIEDVRSEWKKVMDNAETCGKTLTEHIAEIRVMEQTSKDTFEKFRTDDVEKYEQELKVLEASRTALLNKTGTEDEQRQQQQSALVMKIRSAEEFRERGNLTDDEWLEFTTLTATLPQLESACELASSENDDCTTDIENQIEELVREMSKRERQICAAKTFLAKKSELQFSGLSLNKVAISLCEFVKTTDELKSVFKFTYDGKPYKVLSLSEKIKAGIEVSVLIQRLVDFHYPVFIDNAESIEVIDNVRPTGQCIVATMMKGSKLCVEPVGQPAEDIQQKTAA